MSDSPVSRQYRVERYLSEGRTTAIYEGRKLGLGGFEREVVLKQLLPEFTALPEARNGFFVAAKTSASLHHANIVETFDLVESDESLFIVREYVKGESLDVLLRPERQSPQRASIDLALSVLVPVCEALTYVDGRRHPETGSRLPLIHGNLSPSNVLISTDGQVKVADFGEWSLIKATLRRTALLADRREYQSPEVQRGGDPDPKDDVYAAGIMLLHVLTGSPHRSSRKPEGISEELLTIAGRALARHEDRCDASALYSALSEYSHKREKALRESGLAKWVAGNAADAVPKAPNVPRPQRIFLSYRRRNDWQAGRLGDHLRLRFRRENVFQDVHSIPPGADFRKHITSALRECSVCRVVIGPGWLGEDSGRDRITDADDVVRHEIETALEQNLFVLPILLDNESMPRREQIPPSLKPFIGLNGTRLRSGDFNEDVERIMRTIEAFWGSPSGASPLGG